MKQIAIQAAQVRQTFEASSKKRHTNVSSATAAAAQHMANLNKRRKLEKSILNNDLSVPPPPTLMSKGRHFHSAIASFTRPEPTKKIITSAKPSICHGITLKSQTCDIVLNPNDVVQGNSNGKTTQSLVGNQRFRVWVDLYSPSFAKALTHGERIQIAASVVNAVIGSLPQGRFLVMDINSGLWNELSYEGAVDLSMRALMKCTVPPATAVTISTQQVDVQRKTIASRAA